MEGGRAENLEVPINANIRQMFDEYTEDGKFITKVSVLINLI